MAKARVYKRRRSERTDYYRIIESRFEELEGIWPECFEHKYGYLRKEVTRAIYAFLDCGIPENGVARVFCDGCGRDYFLPFSCRIRVACPSCSTKRSILFGEKIRELVKPISHLHVTFTIPKILRAWFRRNRKLFKLMVQSANWAMRTYFIESLGIADGCTGGIYCVHSHGKFFNHHPHVHALVPAGIMKDGVFHEFKNISGSVIAGLFRARLLSVLLDEGVISQQMVDLLLTWNHHSGFNVHARGRISGADRKAIENVARYMSRAAISVERVRYNRTSIKSKKYSSISVSGPYGPRRLSRRSHRPTSLGRRSSTTSLTWMPTYRTRSIRIEPSSQDSPVRKCAPENSRSGPYPLTILEKPFSTTRNGPICRFIAP